jgi:hypothetical protein
MPAKPLQAQLFRGPRPGSESAQFLTENTRRAPARRLALS